MAGDTMKKVQPGDRLKIPAETFNTFIDTARAFRADQQNFGAEPRPELRDRDVVLVKNSSGEDRQRFDVLGIADALITPTDNLDEFQNRSPLTGVSPVISGHVRRFVVLLEPVADGAIARAALAGIVPVRLKVVSEWHQFAHIVDDDSTRLVSDCVGYPILWKDDPQNEDENGNRWALVKIGGPGIGMGVWKNAGAATVGPHEHFRVTGVDPNTPAALTGIRPSDRFGPDYAVNGSQPVASDEYGVCQRSEQVFVAHGATSPEPGDHLGPVPGSGAVVRNYPPTCRCLGAVDAEHGIVLAASYRPAQRFKLQENLYECGTASARIMGRFGYVYSALSDYAADTVGDTLGAVAQSPLALRDNQTGKLYIPAGKCLNARYAHSPGDFWEAIDFGECTCSQASSLSSGSSSGSSGSSSGSLSGSGSSSASDSGSQSGSQSASGSGPSVSGSGGSGGSGGDPSSGGSQGSGSQPSGSQPSGSQGSGGSGGSGSDKSTAIVPASWSPTGYTALFIAECPEVRFDDVMVVKVGRPDAYVSIDPKFLEVCEAGSVQVCGCTPDIPVLIGAVVEGGKVHMRIAQSDPNRVVQVVIRLTGIRKGFRGRRFPDRTRAQFEANERFIKSAYGNE